MTETTTPPIQDGDVGLRVIHLSMSNQIFDFTSHILSPISTLSSSEKGDLYSLSINSDSSTRPPPRTEIPFFREILGGVLFSRSFIKSYNLALLGCLLAVTAIYQVNRLLRRRRCLSTLPGIRQRLTRDNRVSASISVSESSSSDRNTPLNDVRKPLIPGSSRRGGATGVKPLPILHRIRGVLAHQPTNIELFGLSYECPPISVFIVTACYYVLNVFYAFYRIPFHTLKMFVFADRLGLVFVSNLPLLYLMAAKNCPVKSLTGWSYEQLNVLHRAVGRVCITAAIGHFATFIWVWDKTLYNFLSFRQFVSTPVIFLGLLAWISYLLIGATSKEEFRNAFYEVFLFVHVLFQIFALAFLYFHHKGSRPYVLACVFIFVIDRIVLRLMVRSTRAIGTATILPDKQTVRVTLRLKPSSPLKWHSGDHVFLSVPLVAYLHPHPFSIASTPGDSLKFLIRARDGFSRKLLETARSEPGEFTAVVDGPYGSCFAWECLQDTDVALLVAGGSGIAVIYPLAHELVTTAVSTGDEEDGTKSMRGNDFPKRIVLVWVVREECQLSWLDGGELDDLRRLGVEVVTHVTQRNVGVGKRPKMENVVEGVGCDLRSGGHGCDSRSDGGRLCDSMGVVVCGPSGMVRDTRNSCAGMMRRGLDVRIVTEKFGW